jgi:NAD(P)-dependent dehydrogenase (short-subunit alcohol dehydrogenase family)
VGPIDLVHNNAGPSGVSPLVETSDEMFEALVRTNLAGSFYVLREAARVMQPRGRGAIVNTASELALIGEAGYVAYTATKGAILAMTRSAAAELAPWGVRVNAVCPGTTRTPMFLAEFDGFADPEAELAASAARLPMRRHADAREIADAVAYLLSDRASYITGTHLTADGGRTSCVATEGTGDPLK